MEKYGFFSSVDGDRLYTAQDFTSYFGRFLTNGYFSVEPGGLKVTANGTLELTVAPGSMWINGHIYELTEAKTLTIDAQANLARKDRVVIKLDHVNREIRAEIKKGEPSDVPSYPELQRDEDAYEMCIAQYHIDKGITQMYQSYIQDTRKNIDLCGEVTSILDKRSLLDFCQVAGFTMDGVIESKDIVPNGNANIGAIDNRYKKIYCEDIDIANGLPYLPNTGGEVNGTIKVADIIPLFNNTARLGTSEKRFAEAHITDLHVYGETPFLKRIGGIISGMITSIFKPTKTGEAQMKFEGFDNNGQGDGNSYIGYRDGSGNCLHMFRGKGTFSVANPISLFSELRANALKVNNHQVYIQPDTPTEAKAGDVWIKI